MQFDEQPILALNKAIKYGAILMCAVFIVPAMKVRDLYDRRLVGFTERKIKFIQNILKGFVLSCCLSIPLLSLFLYLNIKEIDFKIVLDQSFLYIILFTVFISLLISLIEESFFRGIMIPKKNNLALSFNVIILSSLIYSLFHFIKIPLIIDSNLIWNTGIIELLVAFSNFFKTISIDAAITLLMFGILLGIIRVKNNTISYGIGIHAGFIFIIKTFKANSSVNYDSSNNFLISAYDNFTGHLATSWIIILILGHLIYLKKKKNNPFI
jgi:membrane protease YdiL (CAAX protease family)